MSNCGGNSLYGCRINADSSKLEKPLQLYFPDPKRKNSTYLLSWLYRLLCQLPRNKAPVAAKIEPWREETMDYSPACKVRTFLKKILILHPFIKVLSEIHIRYGKIDHLTSVFFYLFGCSSNFLFLSIFPKPSSAA